MLQSKYEPLVKALISEGVDFSRDVWQLHGSELSTFAEYAKKYGYKKPLLHSRGFGFYCLLQRVYNKMEG